MSETAPATAQQSLPVFIIVKIITGYGRALEDLTATSADSLHHAMHCTSCKNVINVAHMLHSSENLSNQFATVSTDTENVTLECNTAIAEPNELTTHVLRLDT
jgi:hypothetical protein